MNYWLVKSDPEEYGWTEMVRDNITDWTGIRSYAARIFLKEMKLDDEVLFYHSGKEKVVVGIVKVAAEGKPDKTSQEEGWIMVKLKALKPLKRAVSLAEIKGEKELSQIPLLKITRLSVMPLKKYEFELILKMSNEGK